MRNNEYTATPNWFKLESTDKLANVYLTNYYIGGFTGSGGNILSSINLYNKYIINTYRLTIEDLLIPNTAIIAVDSELPEGQERPEDFVSEVGELASALDWYTSYSIRVLPNTIIKTNLKSNAFRYGIVFYDKHNTPISGYTPTEDGLVDIQVPETANYFKCCHLIELESEQNPFYIEYLSVNIYDDDLLNEAYSGVFEDFTKTNNDIQEGITKDVVNNRALNLIFLQPLLFTTDKAGNIKVELNNDILKDILLSTNCVNSIKITGLGNTLTNVTFNENESSLIFEKDWLLDITTDLEVTGLKDFINGIKLNNQLIKIENGILYLDCSVAITGGLTVYAQDEQSVPDIWEGAPFDNITIHYNPDTEVIEVIGGVGSSFDEEAMWSALSSSDSSKQISLSHLSNALSGYATQSWVQSQNYATQSSLNTVSEKLNDFLEGSDTDTIINKWKELEAFLSGMTESDNLADILSTKADITYVDSELTKYVTLATEQEITAIKHFIQGLSVGASKHRIYEQDGVVYLEGDLAVTGGVTAYALGDTDISTIMDGVVVDGTTIAKVDGVLKVLNAGGGEAGSVAWDNITGKPSWIGATKPTYNWSEILAKPTTLAGFGISSSDVLNTIKSVDGSGSGLDADTLDGINSDYFFRFITTYSRAEGQSTQYVKVVPNSVYQKSSFYITRYSNGNVSTFIFTPDLYANTSRILTQIAGNANAYWMWYYDSTNKCYYLELTGNSNFIILGQENNISTSLVNSPTGTAYHSLMLASIEDNVASASKLTTNAGSVTRPVYFSNGIPVVGTYTFGNSSGNAAINNGITCSNLNADMLDGVHLMGSGGRAGVLRSWSRGTFTSANQYFGNGSVVTIDPIGTGCISANDTILSLGDLNVRNTQLLFPYDRNRIYYRRIRDELNYGSWLSLAFLTDNVASATKLQTARNLWGKSFDGTSNIDGCIRIQANEGNYSEGLRIKPYGSWSTIILGGNDLTGNTGTSTNSWGIHNNNGLFYINKGTSNVHTGYELCNVNGNWGISTTSPSAKLHVAGDILSTGGVTCYSSDLRAKTIIEELNLSLKDIAESPTIRFKWNNWKIKDDGKTHIGGIAQYVQKILPETILEADGMLNLDYATTAYIYSVQTARHLVKTDTEVDKLKRRIKKLEKQLKKLGYEEVDTLVN